MRCSALALAHERLKTDESKGIETAKAQACAAAQVGDQIWKTIG
jgi:hypothetical protein